ncbi:Lrguk [Symbiodinium natans]|uniref:Lrguk protein n=1 Tax=Symbiodinium natans TaxID=878477 RepID=A0A812SLN5_9DINO|nr:Lrguk [Symbiodinium natans]
MVASESARPVLQITTTTSEGLSLPRQQTLADMISEEEDGCERFHMTSDQLPSGDESLQQLMPAPPELPPEMGPAQHYELLYQVWQEQQGLRSFLEERLEAIRREISDLSKRDVCAGKLKVEKRPSEGVGAGLEGLERELGERARKHGLSQRRGSSASRVSRHSSDSEQEEQRQPLAIRELEVHEPSLTSVLPHMPEPPRTISFVEVAPMPEGPVACKKSSLKDGSPMSMYGGTASPRRAEVAEAESNNGSSGGLRAISGKDSPAGSEKLQVKMAVRRQHSLAALRPRASPKGKGETSLSALFQRRESQCLQESLAGTIVSAAAHAQEDMDLNSSPTAVSEASPCNPRKWWLASIWVRIFEISAQVCGLTPWARGQFADVQDDGLDDDRDDTAARWWRPARILSRMYHGLVMLLNTVFLFMSLKNLVCSKGQEFCAHGLSLVTDVVVALGALFAVWTCGGLWHYEDTAEIQVQTTDHLAEYVRESNLDHQWHMDKGGAAMAIAVVWLAAVCSRGSFMVIESTDADDDVINAVTIASMLLYSLAAACLLNACYLQMSMWRGLSLSVVAFARSVLKGEITCQAARAKWREVISCMRHMSRMFQLTAAALALTTVFVFFGTLADVQQDRKYALLPNLLIALSLPGSLVVAATATAHCTRLPSLVSMLNGSEAEEAEYMGLAMFLTISESGFFMWDTRVTLGVVQRFLYFTLAIVGTIGFQTKVLTLESFG